MWWLRLPDLQILRSADLQAALLSGLARTCRGKHDLLISCSGTLGLPHAGPDLPIPGCACLCWAARARRRCVCSFASASFCSLHLSPHLCVRVVWMYDSSSNDGAPRGRLQGASVDSVSRTKERAPSCSLLAGRRCVVHLRKWRLRLGAGARASCCVFALSRVCVVRVTRTCSDVRGVPGSLGI